MIKRGYATQQVYKEENLVETEIDTNENGSILAICDKPEDHRSASTSMVLYRPQE